MTLLSAPAGFGKTGLLSEWLRQIQSEQQPTAEPTTSASTYRTAWLSLDENENDPVRFLTYLIAALQTLWPELDNEFLPVLRTSQLPSIEAPLVALINTLTTADELLILVLDDYHVIDTQAVHDSLNFLLEYLPTALHIVLSTRTVPPLQLARLRGHGLLTELNANDLRFTLDETQDFLQNVAGLSLSADDVTRLDQRIEGWPAGWQLAALSLRDRSSEDARYLVSTITRHNRYIADYLMEEVLQHQSPLVKDFLLRTSILSCLSAPLCEALRAVDWPISGTGPTAIQEIPVFNSCYDVLDYVVRPNLFLVPLDSTGEWYRYDLLFTDFLRNRLPRTSPELLPGLHRRASEWFEQNGWLVEAVNHSLRGNDLSRAAELIGENAQELLKRGEVTTLWRWLQDERLTQADPRLAIAYAWSLIFLGSFDTSPVLEQTLDLAGEGARRLSDHAQSGLLTEVRAIRTMFAIEQGRTSMGDIQQARK